MQSTKSITLEKTYKSPIEMVWKAISDREQTKKWYFDFPESFKMEVGSEFDWMGGEPNGKQWLHRGKITEVIPGKKLVHTWEYPGYSGASTIIWDLTSVDENTTKLNFTHEFTVPFDEKVVELRRENFAEGWNHNINIGLKEFLEK
jgi:uncharacterized protein YndB with AHSA1/START domain